MFQALIRGITLLLFLLISINVFSFVIGYDDYFFMKKSNFNHYRPTVSWILHLKNLVKGKVIKRPSKVCKSPYVADVELLNFLDQPIASNIKFGKKFPKHDNIAAEGEEKNLTTSSILVHTPALGCGGLQDKESIIFMTPIEQNKNGTQKKTVCQYRSRLAYLHEP